MAQMLNDHQKQENGVLNGKVTFRGGEYKESEISITQPKKYQLKEETDLDFILSKSSHEIKLEQKASFSSNNTKDQRIMDTYGVVNQN